MRKSHIIQQLTPQQQRHEILDWFHLKENLYKVGGSLKRLRQAETLLWQGKVEPVLTLFADCTRKAAHKFCQYLHKHRERIDLHSAVPILMECSLFDLLLQR